MSAWPCLVERHDDDRGAVAAAQRGPGARNALLALLERDRVDDAAALEHLRPASITDHLEESTMTGTALMSGSEAMPAQEAGHRRDAVEHRLVHVHVEDHARRSRPGRARRDRLVLGLVR